MNYLKSKLEEKKITQSELARRLGLNKSTINHYISGRIKLKNLSIGKVCDIARVLDIPIKDFFEGVLK